MKGRYHWLGITLTTSAVGLFGESCRASSETTEVDAWTATDSAGITIVDNWEPEWTPETAWRLAERPVVSIGGGAEDPAHHMHGPFDALRLSDGRVVIADRRGAALVFFDQRGAFLTRVGREGGGPGEFGALSDIARWRGDSIIAVDLGHRRYSVFDAHGRFGRSYALPTIPGYNVGFPIDLFADGAALARSVSGGERREGLSVTTWQLLRIAPDAAQPLVLPDTVTIERYNVPVENDPISLLSAPVLFAHERVAAAVGNLTVVGTTDRLALDFYDASGRLTTIVRVHQDSVPISAEARRTAAELLIGQATRDGTRAALRRAVDRMPSRRVMPAFGRWAWEHAPANTPFSTWFRTDADGNLWVLSFEPPGSPTRRWHVMASSGRWLGAVRMPPGFEPFDIGQDYILGWRLDERDVVLVEMYELIK